MTILRVELIDEYPMLWIIDCLSIVSTTAILADILGFFHLDLNLFGHAEVHECVHSSLVLLQHLCLLNRSWEISHDETIPRCIGDSKHLERKAVLDLLIEIVIVKHLFGLDEEWVRHVASAGEFLHIIEDLLH